MKWKRATASVLAGVVLTTTSPFAVGDVRGGCDNKDCERKPPPERVVGKEARAHIFHHHFERGMK